MAKGINFVRDRQRRLSKLEVQDRKYLRMASVVLGGVVLFCVLAIVARFYFIYSYKKVTDEQSRLRREIVAREEIERSFTVFSHKLKILTDLFGKRKEKQETLAYFSNLFGPDVIIRQLSYNASDEILSFSLQSKNIFVLEDVFVVMNSEEMEQRYPDLQKTSLSRSGDGTYAMSILIALGDKPLPTAEPELGTETEILDEAVTEETVQ